jgi:hypothetical protein
MGKINKRGLFYFTLITSSILGAGIYFLAPEKLNKNGETKITGNPAVFVSPKETISSSDKPIVATAKKNESMKKSIEYQNESEKTFNSIDEIAKEFSREELLLMSDCSKAKLNLGVVRAFISKAKRITNRSELMDLALFAGKNNIRLKMELVRFTNKKFPMLAKEKVKGKIPHGKPYSSNDIFKNIKKNN